MDNKCLVRGLTNLAVVYVVWGSTYLAMRITVMPGGGFEPFSVGWSRLSCASIILFIIAFARKQFVIPNRKQFFQLALTGSMYGSPVMAW